MNNLLDGFQKEFNNFEMLFQIIVQEISIYKNLLQTMKNKQSAIITGNTVELQKLTTEELSLSEKGNVLTKSRRILIEKICESLGIVNPKNSVTKLIKLSIKSVDQNWLKTSQKLKSIISEIYRVNNENRELLQASLYYVNQLTQVLLPSDDEFTQIYNKDGLMKQSNKSRKVLDRQV